MPTYTEHSPTYAAMWTDPDTGRAATSLLLPFTPSGAEGHDCETCGGTDDLYHFEDAGYDTHLACFMALCVSEGGGTSLLALVPTLLPYDANEEDD